MNTPFPSIDVDLTPTRWQALRDKVAGWWRRINLTLPVIPAICIAIVLVWAIYSVFSVRDARIAAQQAQPAAPDLLDLVRRVSALEHVAQAQAAAPTVAAEPPPTRPRQRRITQPIPAPQPWLEYAPAADLYKPDEAGAPAIPPAPLITRESIATQRANLR